MDSAPAIARAQALEAGRRSRVVRHARLMPACEEDAAQMRFAVEDALNTADFGDAGRLVLVRRLRLADLPPRASATWVARAMEEAWRRMAVRAVPAQHPSAARADAAFFASRLDARMAWLAKVAVVFETGGAPPTEWFWPAALPELKALPAATKGAALESVLEAALREGEAAVVNGLRLWDEAPVVALARALPARAQRRLLKVLVAAQPPSRPGLLAARGPAVAEPLAIVARRLAAWAPMEETAASVLAALWVQPVLQRPPSLEEARWVMSQAIAIASQPIIAPGREHPAPQPLARTLDLHTPAVSLRAAKEGDTAAQTQADAPPRPAAANSQKLQAAIAPQTSTTVDRAPAQPARPTASLPRLAPRAEWPWLADAAFTRFGGLMLVLNVLGALQFGRRLGRIEGCDAQEFVRALLVRCLDLAGAPEDDPQLAWLGPSPEPTHAIRLWTLRLRRSLRRHARMDLVELVRRPAHVSATSTHVDVIFALDHVDMRLRRLGLDADPGWVPWFGRIVQYRFMEAQLLPPRPDDLHG